MLLDQVDWKKLGLENEIKQAIILKIQNVSDYYMHGTPQEHWDFTDFPNVAPPWPIFWMEWRRSQTLITTAPPQGMFDDPDFEIEKLQSSYYRVRGKVPLAASGVLMIATEATPSFREFIPSLKWELYGWFFMPESEVEGRAVFFVDTNGQLIRIATKSREAKAIAKELEWTPDDTTDPESVFLPAYINDLDRPHVIWQSFSEVFLALSFCHCRNVKIRPENIPAPLQKKRVRNNRVPVEKFYTIQIEPVKKVLATEGSISEVGLKRALHICRGHFADYTEGKGLFGKHRGVYWLPQHLRGDPRAGIIRKDYEVKPQ